MKRKITSLMLIVATLLSLFTVYSFADSTATTASDDTMVKKYLHYRNSYGDGNDDFGSQLVLYNAANSYIETRAEASGNKYAYFCFNDKSGVDGSSGNVYFQLTPSKAYTVGAEQNGYLIFEMDFNDFGAAVTTKQMLEVHSGEGSLAADQRVAAGNILNVANDSNGNYFYTGSIPANSKKIYIPSNEWVHLRLEFSVLSTDATKYNLKCYIGDEYFEFTYSLGTPKTVNQIRFGSSQCSDVCFGLDNITLYSAPTNLPSYTDIGSVANTVAMKIGAENANFNGTQVELANPPLLIDNNLYCPVDIIAEFAGASCDSSYIVTLEGGEYIHIDDISAAFGLVAKHYSMGLILVGTEENVATFNGDEYTAIMDLMKTFVFNLPTAQQLKNDVKNYTNNFEHPYLMADADKFAALKAIYEKGNTQELTDPEELQLYNYINKYVTSAASSFKTYSGVDVGGVYAGILSSKIPVNSNYNNYNNNGYDNGGRVNNINSGVLYQWAFAYQMTGNLNYARLAYDYSLALGDWNHWGPAHFLNCADAAAPFSISYDWLYNAYAELNSMGETSKYNSELVDTKTIANIILTHAVVPGYIQSNGLSCPWPGSVNSKYSTTTNNWNAVCTSGMIAASLAIIGEEISTDGITFVTQTKSGSAFTDNYDVKISEIGNTAIHLGLETYSDYAAKLASMNMNSLMQYGLVEYAPDGSYVESPGYWTYGTNNYFRMVATLLTATGDDYGFMDSWGMDTTCYFAVHSESSDYKEWSYNDGGTSSQDSSYFFFVGNYYEDENLVRIRKKHLSTGKSYTLFDILFYDTSITGEPTLATEYYMEGIDGYAVRSSWDKGAIYAGIMGGPNTVSHGHMDAGVFVYHNKGKIWFHDLGSDNYNITYVNEEGKNKGYFSNYELYRIGAEGHNIIAITSEQDTLPYGQATNADPEIVKHYSSSEGGYAVIDMSDSYGTHVTSAKRGMLFTDYRSTVIIQDEITFNGAKTAYWFGHYNIASGFIDEIVLSADNKTAFMISGEDMIRVSIVSDNPDLSFEIMDAYTYLLDITHKTDQSAMDLPNTEYNRDTIGKLAIKCENVETLNLAVVIEEISGFNIGCSYQWTNIDDWNVDGANTPETEYKFKADYEDLGLHIGSVTTNIPEQFEFNQINSADGSYATLLSAISAATTTSGDIAFNFKGNDPIKLKRYQYAVVDFDICTESDFHNGVSLGLSTSSGYIPVITLSENTITANESPLSVSGWSKVTLIIDSESNAAYVYVNDSYLATVEDLFNGEQIIINSFTIHIPTGTFSDKKNTMSVDNIVVRTLGTLYDATELKNLLSAKASLSSWSDNIITDPISSPIAITGGNYIYDIASLQAAIDSSADVRLLRDCPAEITVSAPVSINTNGYKLDFYTDSCILDVDGDVYRFENGSITVTWHINSTSSYTEYYTKSTIATFKYSNAMVGKITETITNYADGGVGFKYFTTGWAKSENGTYLTDEEMVVTKDNCEFWLVNNKPLECMFVIVSNNGTVTAYNSEARLRTELSSNNTNQRVVLCSDVEVLNTSAIGTASGGKNLYLNGYTLKHAQNDVHMFHYNAGTGNFNIYGPGNLVSDGSRTVFTSAAPQIKNNYGIKIKNVIITTNVQLADLRAGQHEFINCVINHVPSTSKTFLTLWDRNGVPTTGGTVNGNGSNASPVVGTSTNLITVTFTGCNIVAGNTGTSALISFTNGTYSEVYFVDSSVSTKGVILESKYAATYDPEVKVWFSGSSSVNAKAISAVNTQVYNNVKFNDGVATNLELDAAYMPTNARLTANYHPALIYKVATDYALIKWLDLNGEALHEEYVAVGMTPKLQSSAVTDYLKQINTEASIYTYNTTKIASTGTISLRPVLQGNSSLLQGMDLTVDFALEIYVPKDQLENDISSVVIDGVTVTLAAYTDAEVNGTSYYKYRITRINPANAGKVHTIQISYNDGTVKELGISVITYLEGLLAVSTKDNEKVLAVKIIKYLKSAYIYAGNSASSDMLIIQNILDNYRKYDVLYGSFENESVGTASIKNAVSGAKLYLSASTRFRFTLNTSYSGKIDVEYLGVKKTYDVVNGICEGLDYIQVELPATELASDVIITANNQSVTYNINSYYTALNTTDSTLADMLFCLNEYSLAAKDYINN